MLAQNLYGFLSHTLFCGSCLVRNFYRERENKVSKIFDGEKAWTLLTMVGSIFSIYKQKVVFFTCGGVNIHQVPSAILHVALRMSLLPLDWNESSFKKDSTKCSISENARLLYFCIKNTYLKFPVVKHFVITVFYRDWNPVRGTRTLWVHIFYHYN